MLCGVEQSHDFSPNALRVCISLEKLLHKMNNRVFFPFHRHADVYEPSYCLCVQIFCRKWSKRAAFPLSEIQNMVFFKTFSCKSIVNWKITCDIMCLVRWALVGKFRLQISHFIGLTFVWTNAMCDSTRFLVMNVLPQYSHWNGSIPVTSFTWIRRWFFRFALEVVSRLQ